MENQKIEITAPELAGVEKSKADQITKTFEPMAVMLQGFEERFDDVISESSEGITTEVVKKAKRLRLDISKVRIETEKIRKDQKEEYLRAGKAIDGVSNILKWAVTDKENKLKEIENYFENLEKERLAQLQRDRVEILSEYVDDADQRDLTKFEEDEFRALVQAKKKEKEDLIEAQRKAEEQRIKKEKEAEEERERLRLENEKLKAEQEKIRVQQEQERLEREKEAEELRKKAEQERLEKEKAQRLIQEAEEEKKRKAEALEKERQEMLSKGDSGSMHTLLSKLKEVVESFEFQSIEYRQKVDRINNLINELSTSKDAA